MDLKKNDKKIENVEIKKRKFLLVLEVGKRGTALLYLQNY